MSNPYPDYATLKAAFEKVCIENVQLTEQIDVVVTDNLQLARTVEQLSIEKEDLLRKIMPDEQ